VRPCRSDADRLMFGRTPLREADAIFERLDGMTCDDHRPNFDGRGTAHCCLPHARKADAYEPRSELIRHSEDGHHCVAEFPFP